MSVLHNVQDMDLVRIARRITALAGRARCGKLGYDDIEGSSFAVTSLGQLGGNGFTPVIDVPELAILGAARVQLRAVVQESQVAAHLMLPPSLPCDHRLIDSAATGRFIKALRDGLSTLAGDSHEAPC